MIRSASVSVRQCELDVAADPISACRALRSHHPVCLLLDGSGAFNGDGWSVGPLLAVRPSRRDGVAGLAELERRLERRRGQGGEPETGIAVLLAYDQPDVAAGPDVGAPDGLPSMVVVEVDRSLRFLGRGRLRLTVRGERGERGEDDVEAELARTRDLLAERLAHPGAQPRAAARRVGAARSSLPREDYLRALARVKRHIEQGDIYQANLSQQLHARYEGDELELYAALARRTPAPRSAYLEAGGIGLASLSPETFVRVELPDRIRTRPIKGTRPRGRTPDEDRSAAEELLGSPKDRAELLMIVDLERNDLGRICRTGSVVTPELCRLHSYAAVHHLAALVEGRLRPEVHTQAMIEATFPGGSITGAPKRRAMEILRQLEPVGRNYFTGSLFWFGDDGHVDSSILIRSVVLADGRARIGAGGGVVADSEPEQEWLESNHKARALTTALGFDPEEAR